MSRFTIFESITLLYLKDLRAINKTISHFFIIIVEVSIEQAIVLIFVVKDKEQTERTSGLSSTSASLMTLVRRHR